MPLSTSPTPYPSPSSDGSAGTGNEVTAGLGSRLRPAATRRCSCWGVDDAVRSVPTITPHDLLHVAASLVVSAGVVSAGADVSALQRMLGHASASMILGASADLFDGD